MNHLTFRPGDRVGVDALTAAGPAHGWTLLFPSGTGQRPPRSHNYNNYPMKHARADARIL
jgi:hypothetical protein